MNGRKLSHYKNDSDTRKQILKELFTTNHSLFCRQGGYLPRLQGVLHQGRIPGHGRRWRQHRRGELVFRFRHHQQGRYRHRLSQVQPVSGKGREACCCQKFDRPLNHEPCGHRRWRIFDGRKPVQKRMAGTFGRTSRSEIDQRWTGTNSTKHFFICEPKDSLM